MYVNISFKSGTEIIYWQKFQHAPWRRAFQVIQNTIREIHMLKKWEETVQDSRPQPVIEIACKISISSSSSKFILH